MNGTAKYTTATSLERKREIFSAIGQNFTVKDKETHIIPNEWFVPIEKAYPALKEEYNRLELDKNLTDTIRKELFAQLILSWGDYSVVNLLVSDPTRVSEEYRKIEKKASRSAHKNSESNK